MLVYLDVPLSFPSYIQCDLSAVKFYCTFSFGVNFICNLYFFTLYLILYYHLLRCGELNKMKLKKMFSHSHQLRIASNMYVAIITPHRVTILISTDFFLGIVHLY